MNAELLSGADYGHPRSGMETDARILVTGSHARLYGLAVPVSRVLELLDDLCELGVRT